MVAVDRSPEMVQRCRELIEADNSRVPVEVLEADICELPIADASVVLMYFTLQFIAPDRREELLGRICRGHEAGRHSAAG